MNEYEVLFLDILEILPDDVVIYVEAYIFDRETEFTKLFTRHDGIEYYFEINKNSKIIFQKYAKDYGIIQCFVYVAIKTKEGRLLFEAHDVLENGVIISNSITIPEWFKKKYPYEKGWYFVSKDW